MNQTRRQALKAGGNLALMGALFATGLTRSVLARAAEQAAAGWNPAAFATTSVDGTIKALNGTSAAQSAEITLTAPSIAENGAVVPITVTSNLPKTQSIAILVEKNPNTLAAAFDLAEGTTPTVNTRVKMGQSSNVYALVKADDKFYVTSKEVKVTLGGCGG
ncbi:thiosulfate oxidation carrier protein SoxY [Cupriavidus sp. BIS7]|uniref:thiosulfate oxidation carrier protein SoxY n=1 Tax=Cupriavidus sp. BIS7 TaxID=1217718 RepID=UPI0002F66377|nr:thiosulfate oxidation carrier protein SoxY [Cupriavidus sp. BIS7]